MESICQRSITMSKLCARGAIELLQDNVSRCPHCSVAPSAECNYNTSSKQGLHERGRAVIECMTGCAISVIRTNVLKLHTMCMIDETVVRAFSIMYASLIKADG